LTKQKTDRQKKKDTVLWIIWFTVGTVTIPFAGLQPGCCYNTYNYYCYYLHDRCTHHKQKNRQRQCSAPHSISFPCALLLVILCVKNQFCTLLFHLIAFVATFNQNTN